MAMSRRKPFSVACYLTTVVFVLYFSRHLLHPLPYSISEQGYGFGDVSGLGSDVLQEGPLSRENITLYINAVVDPSNTHFPRLECPSPNLLRYDYLKASHLEGSKTQYFFAINLRQCLHILPRLLGSLVEAIQFLGPENCAVSIVEGNSEDGTAQVLAALRPQLERLTGSRAHVTVSIQTDPLAENRFGKLAELRNMALEPLLADPDRYLDATVVFMNDVAICLEDILELIHQRQVQAADMTCGMDWILGDDGVSMFYDSYVARAINGDLFFDIPPETASFDAAANLLWNEALSRARLEAHRPFQVFSCWNGAVAFTALPLVKGTVSFRSARQDAGECHQAEPQLFCKDMWFHGYGRIAVVPSVNLEYSDSKGRKIKQQKGYTSQWTTDDISKRDKIEWKPPPEMVKCMPTFDNQFWRPWDEIFV